MENVNFSILCDVTRCKHNSNGKNCTINKIKVTSDCTDCTCCGSFDCADGCE